MACMLPSSQDICNLADVCFLFLYSTSVMGTRATTFLVCRWQPVMSDKFAFLGRGECFLEPLRHLAACTTGDKVKVLLLDWQIFLLLLLWTIQQVQCIKRC